MTLHKTAHTYEYFSLKYATLIAILCSFYFIIYARFHIPFGVIGFIPLFFIPLISPNQIVTGGFQTLTGAILGFLCSSIGLYFYSSSFIFLSINLIVILLSSYYLAHGRALLQQIFFLLVISLNLYFSLKSYSTAFHNFFWLSINIAVGGLIVIISYKLLWPILFESIPKKQRAYILNTFSSSIKNIIKGENPNIHKLKQTIHHNKIILSLFENFASSKKNKSKHYYSHFYKHTKKLPSLLEQLHNCMEKLKNSPLLETFKDPLKRVLEAIDHENIELGNKVFKELQNLYLEKLNGKFIIKETLTLFRVINQIKEILIILEKIKYTPIPKKEKSEAKNYKLTFPIFKRTSVIALSTIIIVFAVSLLNLPGQFQGIIAAIVIIAKPTIDASFQLAVYRFAGTILGGVIGVIGSILIAFLTHFPCALLFFFIVILLLSYRSILSVKYHYVYIQAIFAYLFITASTTYPEGDFNILFDRLFGVIEGVLISLIVSGLFSFNSPIKKINTILRKHFQLCGKILTTKVTSESIKQLKATSQKREFQLDTLRFTPWITRKSLITFPLFDQLLKVLDEGLYIYSEHSAHIENLLKTYPFKPLRTITNDMGKIFLKLSSKNIYLSSSYKLQPIEKLEKKLKLCILEISEKKLLHNLYFSQIKTLLNHILFLEDTIQMLMKIKHTLL